MTKPHHGTSPVPNDEDRSAAIARFKHLTEVSLPAQAKAERWPLRLDHCFKRVCLDYAFQDVWYKHLKKPAERNIEGEALRRALQCAEQIAQEGEALLRTRNTESLRYRGKLRE